MTEQEMLTDWRSDQGAPAYTLPLVVDVPVTQQEPDGKRDISEWAAKQIRYRYWLALRSGASEWNARSFVPNSILVSLEHGKTYSREELGINPFWQETALKLPDKLQFIVEKLS